MPALAGIGLRPPHLVSILRERPPLGWLEVHSENYFSPGGVPARQLEALRADYAISLHGVGLSLGSADALDEVHLERLRASIARYQPFLVSEHLCWGASGGHFLNDLLPLPYTREALALMIERVQQVQEYLGQRLLIENVSSYLEYAETEMPEWDFLRELARSSGCGILLDVNNVFVAATNHGFDPLAYIDAMPSEAVLEIHLAGHSRVLIEESELLIDTHDQRVCPAVWRLYEHALARHGARPTLIEWDSALPTLDVLVDEMHVAQRFLDRGHG